MSTVTELPTPPTQPARAGLLRRLFDAWHDTQQLPDDGPARIEWRRSIPFWMLHLSVPAVWLVGWSWTAVAVALLLYLARMFAITGFFHRYFAHRTFRTSRPVQFAFAFLGSCSLQRGPMWWAAHHRVHHQASDETRDPHSPRQGFWWSHFGWWTAAHNVRTRVELIRDFTRFPELVWLDRYDVLPGVIAGALLWLLGWGLDACFPELGTSGAQLFVWGLVSTIALFHATFTINSLAHRWGSRRFETPDTSRNNAVLALLTLGEGWHNNHHYHPHSVRQGFYWWEYDITYYGLRLMAALGLIWDLRPVPARVVAAGRNRGGGG